MSLESNTQISGEVINQPTHETMIIKREREMAFTRIWRPEGWIQRLEPYVQNFTTELSQGRRVIKLSLKIGRNHSRLRKHKGFIKVKDKWNK